jgi:phosphomevalonate kinase
MRFSASAPGKAVLSGEYAVLQGAPAIAFAVDCRARVTVEATDAELHSVLSTGSSAGKAEFRGSERGVIDWLDEGTHGDHELLEHVWRHSRALPGQTLALTLDTRSFFDVESSLKLGFGSSSALTAALTGALFRAGAAEVRARAPRDLLETAIAAHRSFQRGQGSGIDVATAVHGGVIAFTMRPENLLQTLQWPDGLAFSLLWSGRSASTVERLERLERFRPNRSARTSMSRLREAADDMLDVWQQGVDIRILESLRSYTSTLRQFSDEYSLGIFDAGHQELCATAEEQGLVYKPCGAGGGDIGIVLATEDSADAAFAEFGARAGRLGFHRLDRSLDSAGLIYEH